MGKQAGKSAMANKGHALKPPRRPEVQLDLFAPEPAASQPETHSNAIGESEVPAMCGDRWLVTGSPWCEAGR